MSLINEALKRAKEAQEQAPAPETPGPALRPAESVPPERATSSLALPVSLAVIAVLGLLFFWNQLFKRGDSTPPTSTHSAAIPTEPQSASSPTTLNPPAPDAPTARAATEPVAPNAPTPSAATISGQAPPPSPAPASVGNQTTPIAPIASSSSASAPPMPLGGTTATNKTESTAIQPPRPAPLKLQGIIFNPRKPSAVISGRTVFVGDSIGDARVIAIRQSSAILAGAGRTNVLTLDP